MRILPGLGEGHGKGGPPCGVVFDLAGDVAAQASQAAAQETDLLVHALELLGMGVTPGHDRRPLGDTDIGLAQRHALALGLLGELLDRRLQELGVGRKGHVLGLHRGVHRDPGQVALRQGARVLGDAQALGQQDLQTIADALPPMAHAGALAGQLVLKEALAGEVLEIGIVHPAFPELLIRERVDVLQHEHADHKAHRLRRAPLVGEKRRQFGVDPVPVEPVRPAPPVHASC